MIDGFSSRGPVQLAYAVPGVVEAATHWASAGAGPFFVMEHIEVRNSRVRGHETAFDHSSAYGWWGSTMIELIAQHGGGPDPVVGTSGLHHVAHFVDDFDAATTALGLAAHPEVLYAEAGDVTFAFHDTRAALGHLIEIYEPTPTLIGFYDLVRSAADRWDGTDPVRRL